MGLLLATTIIGGFQLAVSAWNIYSGGKEQERQAAFAADQNKKSMAVTKLENIRKRIGIRAQTAAIKGDVRASLTNLGDGNVQSSIAQGALSSIRAQSAGAESLISRTEAIFQQTASTSVRGSIDNRIAELKVKKGALARKKAWRGWFSNKDADRYKEVVAEIAEISTQEYYDAQVAKWDSGV